MAIFTKQRENKKSCTLIQPFIEDKWVFLTWRKRERMSVRANVPACLTLFFFVFFSAEIKWLPWTSGVQQPQHSHGMKSLWTKTQIAAKFYKARSTLIQMDKNFGYHRETTSTLRWTQDPRIKLPPPPAESHHSVQRCMSLCKYANTSTRQELQQH